MKERSCSNGLLRLGCTLLQDLKQTAGEHCSTLVTACLAPQCLQATQRLEACTPGLRSSALLSCRPPEVLTASKLAPELPGDAQVAVQSGDVLQPAPVSITCLELRQRLWPAEPSHSPLLATQVLIGRSKAV